MAYPEEIRNTARGLYLKRWTPQEIKDELGLNSCRVVYFWAEKYGWRDLLTKPTFKGICHPINYSIESKSRLVFKMIDVVEATASSGIAQIGIYRWRSLPSSAAPLAAAR